MAWRYWQSQHRVTKRLYEVLALTRSSSPVTMQEPKSAASFRPALED
jgi:hypothetical protein